MINAQANQDLEAVMAHDALNAMQPEAPAVMPIPDETMKARKRAHKRLWTPEKALEIAAVGCLLAGAIGILRAIHMEHARDALLCLLGSFGTCGFVCYLYFGPGSSAS